MTATKSNNLPFKFVLLCIPVLFVILAINTRTLQGPYYQAYYLDPSYVYLMNSLSIVNGELPGHTDHPGTTVQLIGGLVLKVNALIGEFKGEDTSITIKVLQNPERYIEKISHVLLSIIAIAVFLFGLQVYLETKNLGLAIISQAFPLTFSTLLEHLPRLEPEPLLIASIYLLAATLVPIATGTAGKTSLQLRASIAGTIMGIGLVTKVTFTPLLLFLLVFHGKKAKLFAVIALVVSVIMLTIPIWDSIPRVVNWLIVLMIHSGHYGRGETGLPSVSILLSNGTSLFRAIPIIFCFIPLLLVSLFTVKKDAKFSGLYWLLVVSLLVLISCLAITIKHYSPHYVMQAIALSGFLLLIIVLSFSRKSPKFFVFIISIMCGFLIYSALGQTKETLLSYQKQHNEHSWLQEVAQQYGCRTISYYRSSSPKYALQFGNNFARRIYHNDLIKLYPEHVSYSLQGKRFFDFQGPLTRSEVDDFLQDSNPICLLGTVPLPYNGQPAVEIVEKKGQTILYQFLGFNDHSLSNKKGEK
jgi:hypothetical protein